MLASHRGGFLAGGGISFPTFEHGFGSSTVVNFQVVLASGEVANVNESSHKDLFWAIKSGSTNYGLWFHFYAEETKCLTANLRHYHSF